MDTTPIPLPVKERRSEPVQDIIDRMPTKFGTIITLIIATLLLLLLLFGYFIRYPDTVTGSIRISAQYSPIKLIANRPGRLTELMVKSGSPVKEGEYIAVIQNSANTTDLLKVKALLASIDFNKPDFYLNYLKFPSTVSLGELNPKYYSFINALQKVYDYNRGNLYQKQEEGLVQQTRQLRELLENETRMKATHKNNMDLYKKMADRDSLLLTEQAATEAESDNSRILYLNSKGNYQSLLNEISNAEQRISDNENKLSQMHIQKGTDQNQMRLDVLSTYDGIKDDISLWEQSYVFKASMPGRIEFTKFWKLNQFIESGEEIFTLIPAKNAIIGQVELPALGAGKVEVGQKVQIQLDDYPSKEYGTVTGRVRSIATTSSTVKAAQNNNLDVYLVEVDLPQGLKTNYGSTLHFKFEIKGTADIVSKDRNLISRFFDNLRYAAGKS